MPLLPGPPRVSPICVMCLCQMPHLMKSEAILHEVSSERSHLQQSSTLETLFPDADID